MKNKRPTYQNSRKITFSKLFSWLFLTGFWSGVLLCIYFFYLYIGMPSPRDIANDMSRQPSIRILDKNGKYLSSFGDGYGKPVSIEKLPEYVVGAFIATEDKRFYKHDGIDFRGISRAFVTNILAGRVKQGGSTISQQVAKNLFLSNKRTFERKAKELIYTIWLEFGLSKNEILALYLNRVYMSNGQYGITAASYHYFGKDAKDLTIWQSAVLAGMLKAPNSYNPVLHPKRSAKRAKVSLNKMVDMGIITQSEADKYKRNTVKTVSQKISTIRFFTNYVRSQIRTVLDRVNQDIIVYTTLDLKLQKSAEQAVNNYKKQFIKNGASQVALLGMDRSGAVRSMIGGVDGKTQFNRATQALRPVGSLFKSFVYAKAMGYYSPMTKIRDSAFVINGYSPQNHNHKYNGVVTLSYAFKKSLNVSAVKLSEKIGRDKIISFARIAGIKNNLLNVPSLPLGTNNSSLIEMVGAYGIFATGGIPVTPYVIERIKDTSGFVVYEHTPVSGQAVSRDIISKFNILARGVINSGSGRLANIPGVDIAGKTGTTQDYRDAWFIGYNSNHIAGVWVGNDDNTVTKKITGGWYPALIWKSYMKNVVSPMLDGNLP